MASSTTDRRLGLTGGAAIKVPCAAATTASITLSGEQTVDGVSCVTGDRVLVKNQTSSVDNGVYAVDTGTWTRTLDFDGANDVVNGTLVPVNDGASNVERIYRITTSGEINFGSSDIDFERAFFSSLTGVIFTQNGTGAVERDAQEKMREILSVDDFGAIGDNVIDDTAAIQKAVTAAAVAKAALYFPAGTYKVTSQITWSTFSNAGRTVAVPLFGDGRHVSVIRSTVVGYAFALSSGADNPVVRGLQFTSATGGFLTIGGDAEGLFFDDFFMNGCAATFYSINQTAGVLYNANVVRSRFWASTGYLGGVLKMAGSGINVAFRDSFISQQQKDGDISTIKDCQGFIIDNVQCEGANAATTAQCFWALTGNNFNVQTRGLYLEGYWDKAIRTVAASANRGIRMLGTKAWAYSGKPSSTVLDQVTGCYFDSVVEGIDYVCSDTGAGTGYIITDPDDLCRLENYHNSSAGSQASRSWKLNPEMETNRGTTSAGFVAATGTISITVQLPSIKGAYIFDVHVVSQDANHKAHRRDVLIWDSGHANNWSDSDILGTLKTKGGLAPSVLATSVDTAGLVTVTATSNQSGSYLVRWKWTRESTGS